MKLLVITQKVDQADSNLGSFHEWLRRLSLRLEKLTVICLQKGSYDLPSNVEVLTLGKESGELRLKYLINFYRYIVSRRAEYDGVWVHMNQIYVILGGLLWKFWKKPMLLWYVHRSVTWQLRLAEKLVDHIFTTSLESFRLPSTKVSYVGHGINTEAFLPVASLSVHPLKLVTVGRITRSKDLTTLIRGVIAAAEHLPVGDCHFSIVGTPILPDDRAYLAELKALVAELKAEKIVTFNGAIAYAELPAFLQQQSVFLHASQTGSVDKAVLEPLAVGLVVVTSSEAFGALAQKGLVHGYKQGSYRELAATIQRIYVSNSGPNEAGRAYVLQNHNLNNLIDRILSYFSSAIDYKKKGKSQI
jgi:glycosyltransferase involved in cell wall biosynthesis